MIANAALDALGNATRREILGLLAQQPRSVGAIAEDLPISRPAVSRHLRVLESARLVRHVAEGNRNIFELDRQGFTMARAWLDDFWDEALTRFKMVAENTRE